MSKWIIAKYKPVSLFSLKPSLASSTAAKSLIAPSPYAIKMALINSLFIESSIDQVQQEFEWIKTLIIKIKPPEDAVFNNSFVKVLRKRESKSAGDKNAELIKIGNIFQETIAFREYVFFDGVLELAFEISGLKQPEKDLLIRSLYQINYFGKKGSFFQLTEQPFEVEKLDNNFAQKLSDVTDYAEIDGITMPLDDIGEKTKFEAIDIYSDKPLKPGKDRIPEIYIFPGYQRIKSSKAFTYYSRSKC